MSDAISKGIGNIWNRLFDHRGFLGGEILFALQEFEQKRGDSEVDNLFKVIENITDIKDTQIDKFKETVDQVLPEAKQQLKQCSEICGRFVDLETKFKQENLLEAARQQRKIEWETFMDHITTSYSEINSLAEQQERDISEKYQNLERELANH